MKTFCAILCGLAICAGAVPVTLCWDAPPCQVDLYKVYQAPKVEGPFVFIGGTTNTSYYLDLTPGAYFWYVTASNYWGESGPSNVTNTPAPTPRVDGLKVTR